MSEYQRGGNDVVVVAPEDEKSSVLQSRGIRHIDVNIARKGINPLIDFVTFLKLFGIYYKERPGYIFHYTIKPNIYGNLAAALLRIPSVVVVTGLGFAFQRETLLTTLVSMMYRFSFRFAQKIIFLNKDDVDTFLTRKIIPPKDVFKVVLLHGEGVNTDEFKVNESKRRGRNILLIGRLLWDKGIGEYVEASKIIKAKYPDVKFQILGPLDPGNPAAIPELVVKEWQVNGDVDYLGFSDDVRPFIAKARCVVLPSYREGASRVLMEASAMGCPVVATDVPGCRQIVNDGVTGFLCQPGDVKSLVQSLLQMIELSDSDVCSMGNAARVMAEQTFSESAVFAKYSQITPFA